MCVCICGEKYSPKSASNMCTCCIHYYYYTYILHYYIMYEEIIQIKEINEKLKQKSIPPIVLCQLYNQPNDIVN